MTTNIQEVVSVDDLNIGDQIIYEGLVFTVTGIAPSLGVDKSIMVEESDQPLNFRVGDRVGRFIGGLDAVRDESADGGLNTSYAIKAVEVIDPVDTRPHYYLAACAVAIRDRIVVFPQYIGAKPFEGVVSRINITEQGKIGFTFSDGYSTILNSKDMVAVLERGVTIDPATAIGNIGEITVTLRIDGDQNIDALNAAKLYAVYVQNSKQDVADSIMTQVLNVSSGVVPLESLIPSK